MKTTKIILLAAALMMAGLTASAQEGKDNPDYRFYYKETVIETDEAIITVEDIVSKMEYVKMKLRIQNKTSDYLLFKSWEAGVKYPDKLYHPVNAGKLFSGAQVIIAPNETETKVIDIKSQGANMHVEEFELQMGGLYRVSAIGTIIAAPDFPLPPKMNEFRAGNAFSCNMTKLVKETKVTEVTFQCRYTGNSVGLLQPLKAVARLDNGTEYANSNLKPRTYLMTAGDEEKMKVEFSIPGKVADMQFANMTILWKESFRESRTVPIPEKSAKITFDAGLTAGKNKK